MSDRAIVAYERPGGSYDLHTARWTEGLGARLTARTPFGGRGAPVDTVSDERGVSREGLPERIEFGRHEALLLVGEDYEVATFLALPFGLPDAASGGGALVEARGLLDGAYLHGWVRGFRAALAEAVGYGFDPEIARERLRGEADRLKAAIEAIEGVDRAHIVAGDVDIIAVANVETPAGVKDIAATEIQDIEGVDTTQTYIAMD